MMQEIKKAKLYIFDMDGTILNSMHEWTNLGRNYLKYKGVTPPEDVEDITDIMTMDESASFFQDLGIKLSIREIQTEMLALIKEAYRNTVIAKPGMPELIQSLASDQENTLCVVTTSEKECGLLAFTRIGLISYFDEIYSGLDLGLGKSTGEIYQTICGLYHVSPADTVVFEDADFAVRSAKEAGCYVYGILDPAYKEHWDEIRETADEILCL